MKWIRTRFGVLGLSITLILVTHSCKSKKEYSQIHENIDYKERRNDSLSFNQIEWFKEVDSLKISYMSFEFGNEQEPSSNNKPKKITAVEIISQRRAESGKVEEQTETTQYSVQSNFQFDKEHEISIRPSKYGIIGFIITLIIVIVFIKIRIK